MNKNSKIEWISFPAKEHPRRTILATLFIVGLSITLYLLYGLLYGLLSILFLGGSLFPYYTKTRYKLDKDGIKIKKNFYTIEKKWSSFRSYYPDKNGVLLSPFPVPSRFENFRGIFIPFSDNKEEVLSFIKSILGKKN
ncbi:MAG: hypothetical protein U9N06_03675 [candidate division WOR-3 bacterium]|nr:hypothetical protein [candidate division WOR-3 bacterium]